MNDFEEDGREKQELRAKDKEKTLNRKKQRKNKQNGEW
jgi:hypothetical protein